MIPVAHARSGRDRSESLHLLLTRLVAAGSGSSARCSRVYGYQFAPLPADLLDRIPDWLRQGHVVGGEVIRPNRVYRYGDWLVKLYGRGHPIKDRFRRSAALRGAEWHFRVLPLRTPKPLLAVETRSWGLITGALLVTEFVRGPSLQDLWGKPERETREALQAFSEFMAQMQSRRVCHHDVHPENFLWDGREWVLIDLDAMRRSRPIGRRRTEKQWARLVFSARLHSSRSSSNPGQEERLRAMFESHLAAAGLRWDRDDAWRRIWQRSDHLLSDHVRRHTRGPAPGDPSVGS
jgi:hypothetical protein